MAPTAPEQALSRHVSPAAAAVLARHMPVRALPRGELLCGRGYENTSLHLVLSGALQVWLEGPDERLLVGNIGSDTWVGEASFIDGQPATANVVATEPTELLSLDRDAFEALRDAEPAASAELLRALCTLLADRVEASSSGMLEESGHNTLEMKHPAEDADTGSILGFLARLFGGDRND